MLNVSASRRSFVLRTDAYWLSVTSFSCADDLVSGAMGFDSEGSIFYWQGADALRNAYQYGKRYARYRAYMSRP